MSEWIPCDKKIVFQPGSKVGGAGRPTGKMEIFQRKKKNTTNQINTGRSKRGGSLGGRK